MVIYSCNDPVMCLTFLASLKGMASTGSTRCHHALHNFAKVTEAFLTQYDSRQEAKKNSHHLLSVRMRQGDSLKSYINFFQNQFTKISNCGEEVAALAFISGLQVAHPLYKHLLKHNVAKMSEIISREKRRRRLPPTTP